MISKRSFVCLRDNAMLQNNTYVILQRRILERLTNIYTIWVTPNTNSFKDGTSSDLCQVNSSLFGSYVQAQ